MRKIRSGSKVCNGNWFFSLSALLQLLFLLLLLLLLLPSAAAEMDPTAEKEASLGSHAFFLGALSLGSLIRIRFMFSVYFVHILERGNCSKTEGDIRTKDST